MGNKQRVHDIGNPLFSSCTYGMNRVSSLVGNNFYSKKNREMQEEDEKVCERESACGVNLRNVHITIHSSNILMTFPKRQME